MPSRIKTSVLFLLSLIAATHAAPNILFIAVDDLRPELGCYGRQHIHSPNIDRLASSGVLFERSYCMVPTCGASRASLMTSIRPSKKRFKNYLTWAQKDAPDALPLHTHFKNGGYRTVSLGKVFHQKQDHAEGWTDPVWRSNLKGYGDPEKAKRDIAKHKKQWPDKTRHRAPPYESVVADDDQYPDGHCASKAVEHLKMFAKESDERPFFLAVGFLKPHLPFCAPKKYWDLYQREEIDVPTNYRKPTDVPAEAVHNSGELRSYAEIHPSDPVDHETARTLIHGYYACVSFVDAQVGRLLDALAETGLDKNTIVVLWGDHGWQLGEHGMWNKHSCFETSLHAPLIIRAPQTDQIRPGSRISSLVEFIDVYPTLCDLAGQKTPGHVQGTSLVGLMKDPSQPGKGFAIGRYKNGDSIRTESMRYSEFTDKQGKLTGAMMFDHRTDPNENKNLYSESNPDKEDHSKQLRANMGR